MSDVVGNPEDRFYRVAAHVIKRLWCTVKTSTSKVKVKTSAAGKHVCVMYTPLYPTFMKLNWGMQGYTYFSYFYSKT